ncbi:SHOCT domain-containing protein [Pseudarthrobacter sp. J75]|uniref:SHOCT domain-containing protein n=1 Tax=Micrococcaceae TaxID=1268 RepID=UPI0027867FF6|nr:MULTISPECIES: SHOCT domain-containing protein [Micrococcaceae]MDP9988379.1 putative membrane protein [Arthrobacter oryzae]MEE2523873.1 SHOCT domain-containing protein [Pseudarthrobacter sp. J47]MEE2530303.1 SHOCT domain-containing protein [Pseudarthrobacter sp. J75]
MMDGFGMGGMGLAWIFWVLLIAGGVMLAVVLVQAFTRNTGGNAPTGVQGPTRAVAGPATAREILEERYAGGEISTEEYQERRRILEEGSPWGP